MIYPLLTWELYAAAFDLTPTVPRFHRNIMTNAISTELLAELELERWDWTRLRQAGGNAGHVPGAIRALLNSRSPEELDEPYWKLENHIVVQGRLYQAALPAVSVLIAALACPERPDWVRIGLLDLLFQLVNGTSDESEVANGLGDLAITCKQAARQGLWVLYRELLEGEQDAAKDVLEEIEEDHDRLAAVLAAL
jgi:hypothetical protein